MIPTVPPVACSSDTAPAVLLPHEGPVVPNASKPRPLRTAPKNLSRKTSHPGSFRRWSVRWPNGTGSISPSWLVVGPRDLFCAQTSKPPSTRQPVLSIRLLLLPLRLRYQQRRFQSFKIIVRDWPLPNAFP